MRIALCVLAASTLASAQDLDFSQAAADAQQVKQHGQASQLSAPAWSPAPSGVMADYYRAYYQAAAKHDVAQFEQDTAIYTWQHRTSIATTVLVFGIVGVGLLLSIQQFRRGEPGETSLELSRDGLKIRSPVIGLIVLVVSLVFFYLFLKVVYPISLTHASQAAHTLLVLG
jgi:hypothetical protein